MVQARTSQQRACTIADIKIMRILFSLVLFPALFAPAIAVRAQAAPPTASGILSPSLDRLRGSLSGLRLDKWKAPGPVREETNSNIGSITRDLDGTLPGLLATADSAPGVVSKNLPVFRNVDALYDVLLRIVETADLSAPENETEALHNALSSLEDARRSLGDAMQNAAVAQEGQVNSLQAQLQSHPAGTPTTSTVVNDGNSGPVTAKPAVRRRKPAKPPAPTPQQ